MSTDGSKIPAIRGSRIRPSDQSSAVRKRTRTTQTTNSSPALDIKDRTLNSAEGNPFSPHIERYQEAAERARQDQRRLAQEHRVELHRLQQRHSLTDVYEPPPPPPPPTAPTTAADIMQRFGAEALFRAHIDESETPGDAAARLDKAHALTAAASAASERHTRGLDIAARAHRLNAAQEQARDRVFSDQELAKRSLDESVRRQRYAEAMAEEHAKREAHSRFVRDLLLETYTSDYTDYEPAFTGKLDDPYFVEPYPNQVPLVADGKLPKMTVGPSGVPHGHALKVPNQAKYDHTIDQYTDEVKPFYAEDAPLGEREIAGPLTLPTTLPSSSS